MRIFSFGVFDLAGEWLGKVAALSPWVSAINGTCKYYLRVGKIPTTKLGSHLLPSGGNPISGVVNSGLLGGDPCSRVKTPSGENPKAECLGYS